MDWLFCDQKWQRRCRFVAREFQGADHGTSATFAPASGNGARLLLVAHCCFGWFLSFLEIKDAFLLVDQRERILVEKPSWWRNEEAAEQSRYWSLRKCLPGQRNAAARFFDFLCEHLQSLEFENTPLLLSVFMHKSRNVILCSHVDDLVLCGQRGDLEWLVIELKKKFTIGGEIFPMSDQDPNEPIRFLKKRHFFTEAGIVISPHEKYSEELLKLYGKKEKRKATPDMACENYESAELNEEGKHRFRSAMGTLHYTSAKIVQTFNMRSGIPASSWHVPLLLQKQVSSRSSCISKVLLTLESSWGIMFQANTNWMKFASIMLLSANP